MTSKTIHSHQKRQKNDQIVQKNVSYWACYGGGDAWVLLDLPRGNTKNFSEIFAVFRRFGKRNAIKYKNRKKSSCPHFANPVTPKYPPGACPVGHLTTDNFKKLESTLINIRTENG